VRERDRFVDLVRAASIVLVVAGHWLVADFRWVQGGLDETSALAEAPSLWPLSWLVLVIPLFFFVGGFANARSWEATRRRGEGYAAFVDRRTHRVLVPLLVYLAVVLPAGLLTEALGGLGLAEGGPSLLQPLWFLGVYLVVVALTPMTLGWHRRWGWAVPALLLAVAVLVDVGVFVLGVEGLGNVNVFVIWVLVHQLGYFYSDGRLGPGVAALLAGGLVVAVVLTQVDTLPYPSAMVGVTGLEVGNMHPPNMAAMALGVGAVGAAVLLRPLLVRWLARGRVWHAVVVLNLSVMTIYLWHQLALLVAARAALPLGYPAPEPGTPTWWAFRLLWLAVPALVLTGLVALVGRFERVPAPLPGPDTKTTRRAAALAVVVLGLGLLVLAGSDVVTALAARPGLGPVDVSALMGAAVTLAATWVITGTRHGDRSSRGAMLGAALLLAACGGGYALGIGPLEPEPSVAITLAVLAAALAVAAALPGGPDHRGSDVGALPTTRRGP
jgi:peptidoglycan/LPS O-acetylase OafA/YrhL